MFPVGLASEPLSERLADAQVAAADWPLNGLQQRIASLPLELQAQILAYTDFHIATQLGYYAAAIRMAPDSGKTALTDYASSCGYTGLLRYLRDHCMLQASTAAIDMASKYGRTNVLDWWLRESGCPSLQYSTRAFVGIRLPYRNAVREWWARSGLKLPRIGNVPIAPHEMITYTELRINMTDIEDRIDELSARHVIDRKYRRQAGLLAPMHVAT